MYKFPEATGGDRTNGWEIDYGFLHKISEFIDKKRKFVYTESEIEDVLIAAQQVMEEQGQKENRCTCERCTGILCESLYDDDNITEVDSQKAADQMLDEMIAENPFGLGK